ncbi:MAG: radical SAM protein [Planctomycetia bacterium]|nr:MAG: radical SAM protein [Planctomycetia bacterium]
MSVTAVGAAAAALTGGNRRMTDTEAIEAYENLSIHELGRRAHARTLELHPERYRTYVIDRNINYSNVCTAKCIFCNFKADPGDTDAYILSFDQIGRKIEELIDIGGTQILMQGGLVPDERDPHGHGLPFSWYLDLLRFIRDRFPSIHIHAFSPPEIWAFHQVFGMTLEDTIKRLRDAGLATIPGGGGEILVDRIRDKISIGKTRSWEWLAVMREAHRQGMKTSCTMMMGHIETIEERIEHMRLLRDLQDEYGGFTAFIHWPFQPENTPLGRWKRLPVDLPAGAEPHRRPRNDGRHLLLADAHEYLVWLAISRLYFDNIPNLQSSWVTMGPKIGQLALFFGANDMGSVMMEENVVSQAGTTYRLSENEIRRLIADAGWQPQQRDQYYRPISAPKRDRGVGSAAGMPAITASPSAGLVQLEAHGRRIAPDVAR